MSDPTETAALREWLKGELAKNDAEKATRQPWWLKPDFLMALATLVASILGGLNARNAAIDADNAVRGVEENMKKMKEVDRKVEKGNRVLYTRFGAPPEE